MTRRACESVFKLLPLMAGFLRIGCVGGGSVRKIEDCLEFRCFTSGSSALTVASRILIDGPVDSFLMQFTLGKSRMRNCTCTDLCGGDQQWSFPLRQLVFCETIHLDVLSASLTSAIAAQIRRSRRFGFAGTAVAVALAEELRRTAY